MAGTGRSISIPVDIPVNTALHIGVTFNPGLGSNRPTTASSEPSSSQLCKPYPPDLQRLLDGLPDASEFTEKDRKQEEVIAHLREEVKKLAEEVFEIRQEAQQLGRDIEEHGENIRRLREQRRREEEEDA